MTDWIEHDGGPQPIGDDVWVEIDDEFEGVYADRAGKWGWEHEKYKYRILNQHLIDAARLEGIRLGLEAANKAVEWLYGESGMTERQEALEDASMAVCALEPETIASQAD